MREIPRQARNDSKDFYRITFTQPKESVISQMLDFFRDIG